MFKPGLSHNIDMKTIDLYNLDLNIQRDILDVFEATLNIESIEFCASYEHPIGPMEVSIVEKDIYQFVAEGKVLRVMIDPKVHDLERADYWGLNERSIFKIKRENTFNYVPRETYCGE